MQSIASCLSQHHDRSLILLAAAVCIIGVYACFALGAHSRRSTSPYKARWATVALVAAGCTAWATHFIALLAFQPGTAAAFDPLLTGFSLLAAIAVIGLGTACSFMARSTVERFFAGVLIGVGILVLHYLGQAAYLVVGRVSWNYSLVCLSAGSGLLLAGCAIAAPRLGTLKVRRLSAPLLLLSIAILHFGGMAAETIIFDPTHPLPIYAISPAAITPIVAGVCVGLILLAVAGLKFSVDARAARRRDRKRLGELANVALEGLLICDGLRITAANLSFQTLVRSNEAMLIGRSADTLITGLDLPRLPMLEEREGQLRDGDGVSVPVRVLRSEVMVGGATQVVFAVRDQRERLRTEAKMRDLAFTDALTTLPNRARFLEKLATCARERRDEPFAVLAIDLDRFKPVNDSLGHAAGDAVLRQVAERLRAGLRNEELVARLGGDEFAVLQPRSESVEDALALARRCIVALAVPFTFDGQFVHVGASVGVSVAPADGDDPAELLRHADQAMYAAKAAGKGVARAWTPALEVAMQSRRLLEAGLRKALELQEFELHYQPMLDAHTNSIASAEALLRWRDGERGLVSPADFIPLAEETGLIVRIGEWVLQRACADAATWPAHMSVAVNLSPVQFRDPDLVGTVRRALASAKLQSRRLELEITEGVLMSDERGVLDTLLKLKAEGVRISMDDFGTGYSSLSYLRRFPFDKIKVDQSFIRQLPADLESAAIVKAIITMGSCLGIATTVEGVETAEQLEFTAAHGCDHVQGFLVSRPLRAADLNAFLDKYPDSWNHEDHSPAYSPDTLAA